MLPDGTKRRTPRTCKPQCLFSGAFGIPLGYPPPLSVADLVGLEVDVRPDIMLALHRFLLRLRAIGN
jgi:hypothetical protein